MGENLLLVYFLVISDSSIRTCLHLCCRFVGEERGVHTQVKQSLFPGLPYLAFHHLQCWQKAGWNLGARLFQTYKYAIVMIVTRSWACSMRLAVYAVTQTVS